MDLNKDIKDIRFNVDLSTFSTVYKQYKNFLLPVGIIIASVILFFVILIPQVQGVLGAKETEAEEMKKLESLKESFNNLANMNETTISQDLASLNKVLPPTKDFAGIINSISSNAVKSGVSVGNFEFKVGDLSTKDENVPFPTIQITLAVNGTANSTVDFIKNLYESSPVAEINSFKFSGDSTTMKIKFYYKASPAVSLDNSLPVVALSESERDILSTANQWSENVFESPIPVDIDFDEEATGSSRVSPFQ
jgi:Tfp pilus assembly protein PilO